MTGVTGFTAKLYRSPAAFLQLRPTWSELWETAQEPSPFLHPAWSEAWWRTFGDRRELAILEVRAEGKTAIIAPLQISRLPLGLRRLEFLGGAPTTRQDWLRNPRGLGLASSNDVLVVPGHEKLAGAALAACLRGLKDRIDAVRLTALPARSPALGVTRHLNGAWRLALEPDQGRRYRIDLTRGWEEFRAGLSKRQRKDLRYKVNELERAAGHALELECREGPAVAESLDEFVELHLRRWHARGKPGLLPGEDRFYRALHKAQAPIVAFRLMSGSRLVASQFGLRVGRRYAPFNFAFDPAFADQSPSHVLMQLVLEGSRDRDLDSIEMVPAVMARHWRPEPTEMCHLVASRTLPGSRFRLGLSGALDGAIVSAHRSTLGTRLRARAASAVAVLQEPRS